MCKTGQPHRWQWPGQNCTNGTSCPYKSDRAICPCDDLAHNHPIVAARWGWEANGERTPQTAVTGSIIRGAWRCGVCGSWWSWTLPSVPMRLGLLSCSFCVVHSCLYSSCSLMAKGSATCWPQVWACCQLQCFRPPQSGTASCSSCDWTKASIQLVLRLRCFTEQGLMGQCALALGSWPMLPACLISRYPLALQAAKAVADACLWVDNRTNCNQPASAVQVEHKDFWCTGFHVRLYWSCPASCRVL